MNSEKSQDKLSGLRKGSGHFPVYQLVPNAEGEITDFGDLESDQKGDNGRLLVPLIRSEFKNKDHSLESLTPLNEPKRQTSSDKNKLEDENADCNVFTGHKSLVKNAKSPSHAVCENAVSSGCSQTISQILPSSDVPLHNVSAGQVILDHFNVTPAQQNVTVLRHNSTAPIESSENDKSWLPRPAVNTGLSSVSPPNVYYDSSKGNSNAPVIQDVVDNNCSQETPLIATSGLLAAGIPSCYERTQYNILEPGTVETSTAKNNSLITDASGHNNALHASTKRTLSNPRSNATINKKKSSSHIRPGLSALSEYSSCKAPGAAQTGDGARGSRGENCLLKEGDNSSCNDPLLAEALLLSENVDRNLLNHSQMWNSSTTKENSLQDTMGDLYESETYGSKLNAFSETDRDNSDIHKKANGHANGNKSIDKESVVLKHKDDVMDVSDDEKDVGSGPCGWGKLQFNFCQRFRSARWFLVVLTLCGACQGMAVNGFVNTVISTVERRFEISSTESGLIASCYDIMFVILVIPISYFGGQGHKPRYLGIGIFVLGLGSFVFALPHFISANYHVENADETVCKPQLNSSSTCNTETSTSLSNYKYFFYLGQLLHGAGATPLYTLGVTYMDENVPQRSSAFYNGIFYTGAIIGPAIGYMVGAKFLDMYTDVGVDPKSLGLDPSNPKWVGAWWIGFLISGMMGVLLALPLLAFPSALPGSQKYALERGKETQASKHVDQTGQHRGLTDILLSLKYLLTNIPFMFINIAAAADGILVAGFSTFMPKFIEYEFGLSAGTAALYVGLAVVPAGGGATFAGGFVVKCFNLKMRGILRLCTVMSFILCALAVALLMECGTTPFAGVTLSYGQTDVGAATFLGKNLDDTCNKKCMCAEEDYYPVCGRDQVMYFSPCYAGCMEVINEGSIKRYTNCSCVNYNLTREDYSGGTTYLAEFGKCEFTCRWLTVFMVCFGVMIVFVFITSMPSLTATLRCVPDHQRSFGLGIQWIVARCLGSIPGPILFGKMFDIACLLWQKRCSGDGSCFFYDTQKLSLYLLALALAFAFAAALSFLLALCFYKVKEEDDEIALEVNKPSMTTPQISEVHSIGDSSPYLPEKQIHQNDNSNINNEYKGTNL